MLRLLGALLLLIAGCDIGTDEPDFGSTGKCNSNKRCELNLGESSTSCAGDCPPCQAIQARLNGLEDPGAQIALLTPNDSKTINLSTAVEIILLVGNAIVPDTSGSPEFTFRGAITSDSTVVRNAQGCVVQAPTKGAFRVEVSSGGNSDWKTVGYLAKTVQGGPGGGQAAGVTTFHLCGVQNTVSLLRLLPIGDPKGTLDYFRADSCK
jgi:hypothetical protein